MPAKAEIHGALASPGKQVRRLDSRFRGNDENYDFDS